MRILATALVLSLAGAAPAYAQDACWPGQSFSTETSRCEGAPRCTAPLVAHGMACIASVVEIPPVPADAPAEAPGGSVAGWPRAHEGSRMRRVAPQSSEDAGLVTMALVMFDLGWVLGLITAIGDELAHDCGGFSPFGPFGTPPVSCNSWWLALIPVGGGVASGATNFGSPRRSSFGGTEWALATGIPSVLLQIGGLISLAVALANETHGLGFAPLRQVSLSFIPAAANADIGASFVLRF